MNVDWDDEDRFLALRKAVRRFRAALELSDYTIGVNERVIAT